METSMNKNPNERILPVFMAILRAVVLNTIPTSGLKSPKKAAHTLTIEVFIFFFSFATDKLQ